MRVGRRFFFPLRISLRSHTRFPSVASPCDSSRAQLPLLRVPFHNAVISAYGTERIRRTARRLGNGVKLSVSDRSRHKTRSPTLSLSALFFSISVSRQSADRRGDARSRSFSTRRTVHGVSRDQSECTRWPAVG